MDTATLDTLKTVCVAGRASEGFNSESNAQLQQLADDGLLTALNDASPSAPRRSYRPTAKGRAVVRESAKQGVA